jgi:short-subunit dehydrogenase
MVQPIAGAVALVTGGSRGLGPFIARGLAGAGARLAIAARSAEPLAQVASAITAAGGLCLPLAADVTRAADRARLVDETQRALGPIDVLVNNAGVEHGGAFARRAPGEIAELVETNVTAPLLLTRLVLPDMILRGRGHVVTIASLAGKVGYPYAAVYGATKAALLAWNAALRVELEGTGVSTSVVSPGYVKGAGMFAAHYVKPPRLLGETTPDAVAAGVLRALREDALEVVVAGRPFWPVHALFTVAPRPMLAVFRRLVLFDYLRRMMDAA